MANENTQTITLTAADTTAVRQRRFVIQGASGVTEATDGADAVGVSFGSVTATAGDERNLAVVTNDGARVEVTAGAAVAVGADVASDSQGRAIVSASGDAILGKALTAASAAGEIVEVLLKNAGRQTA
jgi:hypothetical protein